MARSIRITHDRFVEMVREKHNEKIEVLGEYITSNHRIQLRCKVCEHVWSPIANEVVRKDRPSGCPKCARRSRRLSFDEFVSRVRKIHGDKIAIIGNYTCLSERVDVKCTKPECGWEWSPFARAIVHEPITGCPKCVGKIPCTHDEYVAKVKKIHGDKISIVGRYKGNSKRIALRCNVDGCNNQWETVAWNLIKTNPTGCRVCADRKAALERTLTQDEFESNLYSAHGGKVIALEPYKTANTRILFKDIECGHEWMCTPNNITKTGCPICNISRGERLIKRLLDERGVDYKQQFKFDDCKNVRALPFDFAIFNDGELYTLIEWQGRQHFEPVETFGGDESFEQTRLRDYIKWDYCVSNNIRIAYIPYYTREDDLPEILDGILPPKEVIVSV